MKVNKKISKDIIKENSKEFKIDKVKQGKKNRRMGADFERRTRKDLEEKGWIVSKWQNNIKEGKCVSARPGRFRMMQTGFPDFIAYRNLYYHSKNFVTINFVECKCNGYLNKIEKEKAKWYLKNNYCSRFLISSKYKEKNRVKIKYKEFK